MIYVDWFYLVFMSIMLIIAIVEMFKHTNRKGNMWLLWGAACIVFLNTVCDLGDNIIKHYEEQLAVKEVRV